MNSSFKGVRRSQ